MEDSWVKITCELTGFHRITFLSEVIFSICRPFVNSLIALLLSRLCVSLTNFLPNNSSICMAYESLTFEMSSDFAIELR